MELPSEASFPLSKRYYDHCKNIFYPFSKQQLSGKHIPSSKSWNLLVLTIIEKMESTDKITEENLSQKLYLVSVAKNKDSSIRVKV